MKLLVIYGPPACGKLTVAREIRKQTGFRICHNHLSLDYATELFDLGTKEYDALCTALRQLTFEHAVRAGLDLIFTFCYSCPEDNGLIAGLEALVTQGGGSFCLIHLTCGQKELEQRCAAPSREGYKKIRDGVALRHLFDRWDFFTPVPGRESLCIDNTTLSAGAVADRIIAHYNLGKTKRGSRE